MLEDVFRDEWGRVLASLVGFLGDVELAEDAAQEAFATAAERWPSDGTPPNPTGWLITTARNRAIDRIRREQILVKTVDRLVFGRPGAIRQALRKTPSQHTRGAEQRGGRSARIGSHLRRRLARHTPCIRHTRIRRGGSCV